MINNRKRCGLDGIPGELIKYGRNPVANILNFLITSIWSLNYVPDERKEACIILLLKKKDNIKPDDMITGGWKRLLGIVPRLRIQTSDIFVK